MLLRLLQAEELDRHLLEAGGVLARVLDDADGFETSVSAWLARVETALSNNRLTLSATVAAARARLQTTLRPARGTHRTRRDRAELCVRTVEQVVTEVRAELATTHTRLDEADTACRRLLAVAKHKGLTHRVDPASPSRTGDLVRLFEVDTDVAAGVVQLDALLGRPDVLIVLARRLVDLDQQD